MKMSDTDSLLKFVVDPEEWCRLCVIHFRLAPLGFLKHCFSDRRNESLAMRLSIFSSPNEYELPL